MNTWPEEEQWELAQLSRNALNTGRSPPPRLSE